MRLATEGLAEKFRNMPKMMSTVTSESKTLSTVHHQLLIKLRLLRENFITLLFSYFAQGQKADDGQLQAY